MFPSKSYAAQVFILGLMIILICTRSYSQVENRDPIRIMFYNTENLFDVYNDSLKEDDEFLPEGIMRWNSSRYDKKINSLYKTIVSAGEWSPPEVIAFCEVENRKVLKDLIYGTYLSKYNYRIIHEESPDPRGIDVCLIYRTDCISVISYKYWTPFGRDFKDFKTRTVLYLKMAVESDTIHLIVNHWPSRRGGVLAAEDLRMEIASMVKQRIDSMYTISDEKIKVLLVGDFNSTPDDKEMRFLKGSAEGDDDFLVNLSEPLAEEGKGTYKYRGTWEMIDQALVSKYFLSGRSGAYTDFKYVNIFSPDFLLVKDPVYPGVMPFSTYRGYKYSGGTSDHLPVLVKLSFR
jgi:hypothetical protein